MEERTLRMRGWTAMLLAVTGAVVPTGIFMSLAVQLRNDRVWLEGVGYAVLISCLLTCLGAEVSALLAVRGAWRTLLGSTAGGIAVLCLVAVIAFLLWLGALRLLSGL